MARIGFISTLGPGCGCDGDIAATAPAYASNDVQSLSPPRLTPVSAGNVIVVGFSGDGDLRLIAPLADLSIPAAIPGSDQRPTFKPAAIKQRASRSAVRPTAIAGWRSGRTRHLAVA
jgi:hypothetical protein